MAFRQTVQQSEVTEVERCLADHGYGSGDLAVFRDWWINGTNYPQSQDMIDNMTQILIFEGLS